MKKLNPVELQGRSDLGLEELAVAAGSIATYLDKSEHLECSEVGEISSAAGSLRTLAVALAKTHRLNLIELYACRLDEIERRNVLYEAEVAETISSRVDKACTLRDYQLVQLAHDRVFHPDVFGLPRDQQLQHFLLHLAKIMAAAAKASRDDVLREDFLRRRVPDIFLFGLKIASVVGERLDDALLPADLWH